MKQKTRKIESKLLVGLRLKKVEKSFKNEKLFFRFILCCDVEHVQTMPHLVVLLLLIFVDVHSRSQIT
ncbi:CLUMA_CG007403, isoform A [Clunio marinus]|uniref:CLUMA_CG007403, isoform A n=1 Tax=Clunio marinus TaxID=568069 RepID=A0A1J1I2R0_9DIPT|nr:CLUMA_CG007403, isoform A [Clunio marinus]